MSRRIAVAAALILGLAAFLAGAARPSAQTVDGDVRPVAQVVRITVPPLFEATGAPSGAAGRHVEELLARLGRIGKTSREIPFAIALDGVVCDELRALGDAPARRAIAALRELAAERTFLRTLYSGSRLDHVGRGTLGRQLRLGDDAVERCTGRLPDEPFLPPDGVLGSAERLGDLAALGVGRAISAFAVPPARNRPRIVPGVLGVPGDPSAVRPEADGIVVVLDPDEIGNLAGPVGGTVAVELDAVAGADVVAGAIGPEVDAPSGLAAALAEAEEALTRLGSFTLSDDRQARVLDTVLARARSTARWWPSTGSPIERAEGVVGSVRRRLAQIGLETGPVTFTAQRGVVPVTVSNDSDGPIDVFVEVTSTKLDFPEGRTQRVTIEPPGDTVTFEALARSSGTFPVDVTMRGGGDHDILLDSSRLTVRSAASNLSAVILTAGGAIFLVVWVIRRRRALARERGADG